MKIVHRVSISADAKTSDELSVLGIAVDRDGLVTFEVDESRQNWAAIENWIKKRRAVDIVRTRFSKSEIAEATWAMVTPDWHHGYPQPDDGEFGYRAATFDLSEYCEACGVGMHQKAPFQMKGEPKWGKRRVLQLNWVFDEYFATPEAWEKIFKPHGVDCRSVLNTKGKVLGTVVQLVIPEEVPVVVSDMPSTTCRECGRTKFLPVERGFFPPLAAAPENQIVRTTQYFGHGASAFRPVLVSRVLAREINGQKGFGASLWPCGGTRPDTA